MENIISPSTKRNWEKLKASPEGRLSSRANKKLSQKHILPHEYLSEGVCAEEIDKIAEFIRKKNISRKNALYSLGVKLLSEKGILNRPHVRARLESFCAVLDEEVFALKIPKNQRDFLGTVYQCLLDEGQKNRMGSYYTPAKNARIMLEDIRFDQNSVLLDPCCGSGSFFLEAENLSPERIYGVDSDPIAVMLAQINLLLKFPLEEFEPHIYCADFLCESCLPRGVNFTHIVTNPPWGAQHSGKDSFELFFRKSCLVLAQGGEIRFLLPSAFLNVKAHKNLRKYILENLRIISLSVHSDAFSGVLTDYVHICARRLPPADDAVVVQKNGEKKQIPLEAFRLTEECVFGFLEKEDLKIIAKARKNGVLSLKNSTWAMGIVTGNNKAVLSDSPKGGREAIYTGREIRPYTLLPPKKYIKFTPEAFQQAAKEQYYRAKVKILYRFIGKRPVFAVDRSAALILNSVNMLIPKVENMSAETVAAFMNSDFAAYFYEKVFGGVKILKGNLCEIPLVKITPAIDGQIAALAKKAAEGISGAHEEIQKIIYALYGFSEKEIRRIKESL